MKPPDNRSRLYKIFHRTKSPRKSTKSAFLSRFHVAFFKSLFFRLFRFLGIFLFGFFGFITVLSIIWIFITPVSTLMVGNWFLARSYTRTSVLIKDINPNLILAVINSEDAQFCNHQGVDWKSIRQNITTPGGPRRGASTIPMQTAKNLYLWHGRSYLRKALEVPIAQLISLLWSKQRMLEIYLNIAEWGDGIFGAEAAARHYFKKSAANLTQKEAALLATALPNPFRRNPKRPDIVHTKLANILLKRMQNAPHVASCILPQ